MSWTPEKVDLVLDETEGEPLPLLHLIKKKSLFLMQYYSRKSLSLKGV